MTHKNSVDTRRQRLFERGQVYLVQENQTESAKVSRGMAIVTRDGREAGKVAAVVVDSQSRQVSHVLLGRPHLAPDYRLVPVEMIKEVNGETVYLLIDSEAIGSLALHQRS